MNSSSVVDEHNLSAVRILEEIRKLGYNGGYTILKEYCHELRKDRRIPAVYRYETGPGKQYDENEINFGKLYLLSDLNEEPERIYRLYKQREYVEYAFNVYKNDLEADRSYLRDDRMLFGLLLALSYMDLG